VINKYKKTSPSRIQAPGMEGGDQSLITIKPRLAFKWVTKGGDGGHCHGPEKNVGGGCQWVCRLGTVLLR
jgi:hypothetical protein